jgi:hypothetical protein
MATVDEREATEFVLSRMKVVYLVLLDDTPVGYLPTKASASDYASRLALQQQKIIPLDSWSETCIEEQDNELVIMRRSLGLVFHSSFVPYHIIKYVPLELLDVSDITIPEEEEEEDSDSDSDSDSEEEEDSDSDSEEEEDSDSEEEEEKEEKTV